MKPATASYRYIYGPVASWRLGSSLGVDPISAKNKICSFDCIYCQLGPTRAFLDRRSVFVPAKAIVDEIKGLPQTSIDYITFSGAGEPTLAKNLGTMIRAVKKVRKEKIAVITNTSLIDREDVRKDLGEADLVLAKLDADREPLFQKVNRPMAGIHYRKMLQGLKKFTANFRGRLALQIMFTAANARAAARVARLAGAISPDEIQLNTPLRPCGVKPLSKKAMQNIGGIFRRVCGGASHIVNVYQIEKRKVSPISNPDTLRRRGKT